jgi:hypothetical protein
LHIKAYPCRQTYNESWREKIVPKELNKYPYSQIKKRIIYKDYGSREKILSWDVSYMVIIRIISCAFKKKDLQR